MISAKEEEKRNESMINKGSESEKAIFGIGSGQAYNNNYYI